MTTELTVETLVVGVFATNCHVVSCPATNDAVVIDPGGEGERVVARVRDLGLHVVAVINTHGHIDHILANDVVCDATGAPLEMHPDDRFLLNNPRGLALLGITMSGPLSRDPDVLLHEGDMVRFGERELSVIHTPGHTPGSISLLSGDGRVFAGDTLFNRGVGRTDLPGGDTAALIRSIKTRLFALPDDVRVYPGHGPSTTIGRERRGNPYV